VTTTPAGAWHDQCKLTARFTVGRRAVVAQCLDAEGHTGDCTMIDPNTDQPVTVRRNSTKW
jgi:hypothetical protein